MNKQQYYQAINWATKNEVNNQTNDSLLAVRSILTNMGIPLPQGSLQCVREVLSTGDYMSWQHSSMVDATEEVEKGHPVIAINDETIMLVVNEEGIDLTSNNVQTISEVSLAEQEMEYYSYSVYTMSGSGSGCGGEYRDIRNANPRCFGYAMLAPDRNSSVDAAVPDIFFNNSTTLHQSINYKDTFLDAIRSTGRSARYIEGFSAPISQDEYRVAMRVPYCNGINYHFIYQLSDETWAGKDGYNASKHFGWGDPAYSPEMWENDKYAFEAGTVFFAVKGY